MKTFKTLTSLFALSLIISFAFIASFAGCAKMAPSGAYATTGTQADATFYSVDSGFNLAYAALDGAFTFERNNRDALFKLNPDIKHSLDKIRPGALNVAKKYALARRAYLSMPTPAGLTELQTILGEVRQISAAAVAVMPKTASSILLEGKYTGGSYLRISNEIPSSDGTNFWVLDGCDTNTGMLRYVIKDRTLTNPVPGKIDVGYDRKVMPEDRRVISDYDRTNSVPYGHLVTSQEWLSTRFDFHGVMIETPDRTDSVKIGYYWPSESRIARTVRYNNNGLTIINTSDDRERYGGIIFGGGSERISNRRTYFADQDLSTIIPPYKDEEVKPWYQTRPAVIHANQK